MFQLIDFLIVNPIVNILFVIYDFVGDFGLAVILFTVLVKFLVWPLMKRQLDQTKAMRRMQPELDEIRKRCNGNKQMESIEMMNLYKKHNIKPMRSMWTILIQLPIFIALFTAIRVMVTPTTSDYVAKRAYPVVAKMDRIDKIIELQTDQVLASGGQEGYEFEPKLFGIVDLSARPGFKNASAVVILIFALLSALVQYLTSRSQMPKKKKGARSTWKKMMTDAEAGKDPSQEDMNALVSGQMSFMMPLMMLMVMINMPGALVFYYFLSNIITNFQYRIAYRQIDEELDDTTDRSILRELKKKDRLLKANKIAEAEVVSKNIDKKKAEKKALRRAAAIKRQAEKKAGVFNQKTGTTTRVLKASDIKDNSKNKKSKTTDQPSNG